MVMITNDEYWCHGLEIRAMVDKEATLLISPLDPFRGEVLVRYPKHSLWVSYLIWSHGVNYFTTGGMANLDCMSAH
jgi:hypothetical protein